jgi:TorA maturation chaperone TorD
MATEPKMDYQKAAAASDMFQLLALSMHLPQKELVGGLLDGSVAEDVTALFRELGFDPKDTRNIEKTFENISSNGESKEKLLYELRQEYTRLFTHPRNPVIRIYEALFRYKAEKQGDAPPLLFISPAALDAERCYRKAGLKMSKAVKESPDHMGIEMEFMMYLYLQKAKAIQGNDQEELARRNEEIEEFERLHLKRWAKEFFSQCKTASTSKVYSTIGEIGSLFLNSMIAGA